MHEESTTSQLAANVEDTEGKWLAGGGCRSWHADHLYDVELPLADAVSTADTSSRMPDDLDSAPAHNNSLDLANDSVPSQKPSSDRPAAEGFQEVQQSAVATEADRQPQPSRILHACLGPLPSAHISCTAFYFLCSQPGKLTSTDLDSLDCGLLSEGPSIQMLHQVHPMRQC